MAISPPLLIVLSLLLALIPIFLGVCTSYLKIHIVLSLIRNALGTQNTPSTLVVAALSVSLSAYIMAPTMRAMKQRIPREIYEGKFSDFSAEKISMLAPALDPLKAFLSRHTGENERETFAELRSTITRDASEKEQSMNAFEVLVPSFMLSELRSAFQMGVVVLLPFLIIDLIVANVLAGLGMYMMSPATISLPLKLLLFVSSDAWMLLSRALIQSYGELQ